jgi:hypothetical protein
MMRKKTSAIASAIDESNPDPEAAIRGFRRRTSPPPPPPDAALKPYEIMLEEFLSAVSASAKAHREKEQ